MMESYRRLIGEYAELKAFNDELLTINRILTEQLEHWVENPVADEADGEDRHEQLVELHQLNLSAQAFHLFQTGQNTAEIAEAMECDEPTVSRFIQAARQANKQKPKMLRWPSAN